MYKIVFARIHLTEDRTIVKHYNSQHKHRNDADLDPDSKWIWIHDPRFRVAEVRIYALDRTAICILGTPKAYLLI
jgi:hypothetical protein